MNETMKQCPGCGRHCDLSAPSCPRGEAYARGETPAPKEGGHSHGERGGYGEKSMHGERGERGGYGHDHGERNRRGREEGGFARHGGERRGEGMHEHGGRGSLSQADYDALDTDGKLAVKLRELHHRGRGVMESRGGQGKILGILAREGSMTQRALTEQLGIQPGSASEVIGKLERAGLIERSENAADRRTADIKLTEQGREQAESAPKEKPVLFSALSDEEKAQLLSLLEKLDADWKSRFSEGGHRHGFKKDKE